MLRILLAIFVSMHGLIHLMGFARAFNYGQAGRLTHSISKEAGILWLMTTIALIAAGIMIGLGKGNWWVTGLAGLLLSQALIISVWSDARYGTIANLVLLIAVIMAFGSWQFERTYRKDVAEGKARSAAKMEQILSEKDIQHLPAIVQQYLRYTGCLHKLRPKKVYVVCEGEMRDKGKDWFRFRSEQFDFFDVYTRLFFMKGRMYGMDVPGYHAYKNGTAAMQIKLAGLFPVVDAKGPELNKAETVTIFNDMCIMAPGSLADKRIQWEEIDALSARAVFTCGGNTISATLHFNTKGELINFVSDDRYAISDMKQYRFSTPVNEYRSFNGFRLASYGEAVWHYPEGPFTYGKFRMKEITY